MPPNVFRVPKSDLRGVGLNQDFWFPLAEAGTLKRGELLAARFAADPIVLMRTESGAVHALEDRCAHRQVPLHRGKVQGEHLVCGYHAWRYDAQGSCVDIPQLRRSVSPSLCVRSYPCRESLGMIFVFPGDPNRAESVPLPRIRGWDPVGSRAMFFSHRVECHYSFMHENLIDMSHQFLHRSLMGSIGARLTDSREGEDWVEADYTLEWEGRGLHLGAGLMLGRRDRRGDERALAEMTVRTEYPYQMLQVRRPGRADPSFHMWTAYIPLGCDQRACHTMGVVMVPRPRVPGLLALGWPLIRRFNEAIFAQDREAVESEQQAYEEQGASWNREVVPVVLRVQDLLRRKGIAVPPGPRRRSSDSTEAPRPPAEAAEADGSRLQPSAS